MTRKNSQLNIRLHSPTLEPWVDGKRPIIVLMSGGVDSSVTALLLKRAGWDVLGITMKIPVAEKCDVQRSCCGVEAAYVCKDLEIAHYYLDVQDAFHELVIEPFRQAYSRGETPSPCIDCNTVFKFGLVWDFLEQVFGIKHLATGHYARILQTETGARLARGKDTKKDQSYFLYGIPAHRLQNFLLPLGDLTKPEVRALAKETHLPVARRPESMELCFAGEGDYRNALGLDSSQEGQVLDMAGNVIGSHNGIANYTVGQRKGLGIAAGKPIYVAKIDAENNTITVGEWDEVSEHDVNACETNVLIPDELQLNSRLLGKIRSQGEPSDCIVTGLNEDKIGVKFTKSQFAPTPGQRLVLYNKDGHVVAGGKITSTRS